MTSSAAGIYSLHGKKKLQSHNPQPPLTTLSASFHSSVDFAERALRITKVIMNISTQTTRLLAQHLSGIHLSHVSIFRAELGLLIPTVAITEPVTMPAMAPDRGICRTCSGVLQKMLTRPQWQTKNCEWMAGTGQRQWKTLSFSISRATKKKKGKIKIVQSLHGWYSIVMNPENRSNSHLHLIV